MNADDVIRNVAVRKQYNIPAIDAEKDGWPIDCYGVGEALSAVEAAASVDPSVAEGVMYISSYVCAAADKTGAVYWPTKAQHERFKAAWRVWRSRHAER